MAGLALSPLSWYSVSLSLRERKEREAHTLSDRGHGQYLDRLLPYPGQERLLWMLARVCVRALGTVNQSKAGDAEKRKAGHSCLPVTLVVPHINQDNVSSGEHR